eukprot:TRINITY_DN70346_c0_g1_i1.p1 TRINITY_DN70346_c0_g1~~TRINITY_DN70346_c0_g1_i1.p1  ORF type:complete len:377 (-),score=42.04 TRINITY_DN70346_c0_g1_i1:277-1305(-)
MWWFTDGSLSSCIRTSSHVGEPEDTEPRLTSQQLDQEREDLIHLRTPPGQSSNMDLASTEQGSSNFGRGVLQERQADQHIDQPSHEAVDKVEGRLKVTVHSVADDEVLASVALEDTDLTVNDLKKLINRNWTGHGRRLLPVEQQLLWNDNVLDANSSVSACGLDGHEEVALTLIRKELVLRLEAEDEFVDTAGAGGWHLKVSHLDSDTPEQQMLNGSLISGSGLLRLLQELPSKHGRLDVKESLERSGQSGKWQAIGALVMPEEQYPLERKNEFGRAGGPFEFSIRAVCAGHCISVEGWSHHCEALARKPGLCMGCLFRVGQRGRQERGTTELQALSFLLAA